MAGAPYAESAWLYWRAGWRGVLPLPVGDKWPPPRGYTGWAGVEPSGADLQAWIEGSEGAGNIALRLPMGVYGLDVDDYGGKTGGAALDELIARVGEPLPPTWIVTSRGESASGIRLYRAELPPGRRWRDEPAGHGRGIEAIHFGHRYAVVWPSIHPEGRKYLWWRPDGALAGDGTIPHVDELPKLPPAWIEALSEPGEARRGEAAGHAETLDVVHAWRDGEPSEWCEIVTRAHDAGMRELRAASDGSPLHPAARARVWELASLGHEGHVGARRALAHHYSVFVETRSGLSDGRGGDRAKADDEWWRLVRGAVGKLVGPPAVSCDCAAWMGEGVQFDYPFRADATSSVSDAPSPPSGEVAHELAHARDAVREARTPAEALIARLMTAAQLRELPPPEPLVDGLLLLDTVAWLIAEPGSYKSFVALDWAAHVGAGMPWLGRAVTGGEVLYVVAEGVAGIGPRIRAWEQYHGREMTGVRFLPTPVQAARADQWQALVDACGELRPRLVVLDTQARVTVGLDENDNSQMGQFVEAVERVRRSCGACVLTVHHLGRNGQHARGASAIDGAQDTELRLTKTGDRRAVLKIDKSKHTADDVRVEIELFPVQIDGGGDSLVVGPPLMSAPAPPDWRANLTVNQQTLVSVMVDIFPDVGATKAELKAEARKRIRHGLDGKPIDPMSDSSFRRAWDSLVSSGRFKRVTGSQRYRFDPDAGVSE